MAFFVVSGFVVRASEFEPQIHYVRCAIELDTLSVQLKKCQTARLSGERDHPKRDPHIYLRQSQSCQSERR